MVLIYFIIPHRYKIEREIAERRQKQLDEVAQEMESFGHKFDLSSEKKKNYL